jgi:microsomal dipeptidase-like Zn-dependent dipeptidase
MRLASCWILLLPVLILIAGCAAVSRTVDRLSNGVATAPPYSASPAATALQADLTVADMHSDALISSRDLNQRGEFGHLDIPRLQASNVRIQTFTQPTFSPLCLESDACGHFPNLIGVWAVVSGWPPDTWFNQQRRSLFFAQRLSDLAQRSNGKLAVIRSASELRSVLETSHSAIAGVLGIEGDEALEGDVRFVAQLASAGYRIFGLVHQADNDAGGSSQGLGKHGITPLGYEILRAIDGNGMVLDLAHASAQTIDDAVRVPLSKPPIVSHTGLTGVCPSPRNIGDKQVQEIVQAGGIVGIGFWDIVLCLNHHATAAEFANKAVQSMLRVVELTRAVRPNEPFDHVALGSDFDGWVFEGFDVTGLVLITDALLRAGVSEADIRKIMGGNYCRYLLKYLPSGRAAADEVADRRPAGDPCLHTVN